MAEALHKFKLKKEDTVEVITGKDKGKRGKILKIHRDTDRIVVEGVNLVKKAKKKRKQTDRSGIIEIEAAIHSSNLMIVCKKCGPTRIGYKIDGDKKVRICKKCGEVL
ncbi:MAG: 50S ribosomal protein L24 [Treponema sp.]|nr:50S ribosomal protein L24 [Treponema sp.]MCL2250485.1 50S ribosomal protein L24 [Treponema sp.]